MSNNKYYIEKYKDFDKIIKTYYQQKDKNGNLVNIKDIVNPLKIDNRQLASVTDNQGVKPHCAAYSICNLAEAILWKRTGKLINLDADQVYALAKQIDGDVDGEGTYLECAIKAAMKLGGFETNNMKIGFIYNQKNQETIELFKFLIHRYDFLHCGFNINNGWYNCTNDNPVVKRGYQELGGHAVLCCGYDETGIYIQNSWGREWGSMGFCILPWDEFLREFMYACYISNIYDNM
jgi:hypothetical protein